MTSVTPLVVGNWKMNLDHVEAIHLTQQLGVVLRAHSCDDVDVVLMPPFTDLRSVSSIIDADRLPLKIGAQHAHFAESGAFTGEISLPMLRRLGVSFVLVGHSERRRDFGMSDDVVAKTLQAVLASGMSAILCVGEDEGVRSEGQEGTFVVDQVQSAMKDVPTKYAGNVIIAYEPLWSIGTGATATDEQVAEMSALIRSALPEGFTGVTRVLYGGSVKPENAETLTRQGGVDGFLVGGASLKAEDFAQIARSVNDCYGKKR